MYKDTQQKFLVKHIHPFKIISRVLIRNLIYAFWLFLAKESFYLTFTALLSQNAQWFWTCFAEPVWIRYNHGGNLQRGPPGKKASTQFCTSVCRALGCEQCFSPRVWLEFFARTTIQAPQGYCPFQTSAGRCHPVPGAAKAHSSIPTRTSRFSFQFLSLIPQEMPVIGIIYDSAVEPNVSPG